MSTPIQRARKTTLPFAAMVTTIIGLAPLVLTLASAAVANALGCRLDEGGVHPCPLFGIDIGEALYAGGMMLWFFMLTAPIAAIGLLLWLIALVRFLSSGRAKRENR